MMVTSSRKGGRTMQIPNHVAIILDGNGRWAKAHGKPRTFGHIQGAKTVEDMCEITYHMGIQYFTVYAFSTENWSRPDEEVSALMKLLRNYMVNCKKRANQNNMCVRVIGDKTRLDADIQEKIADLEEATKNNTGLHFQIAINYGGRDEIRRAVGKIARFNISFRNIDGFDLIVVVNAVAGDARRSDAREINIFPRARILCNNNFLRNPFAVLPVSRAPHDPLRMLIIAKPHMDIFNLLKSFIGIAVLAETVNRVRVVHSADTKHIAPKGGNAARQIDDDFFLISFADFGKAALADRPERLGQLQLCQTCTFGECPVINGLQRLGKFYIRQTAAAAKGVKTNGFQ